MTKLNINLIHKKYPNATVGTSHAGIYVIQKAYDANCTKGENIEISTDADLCGYCLGDIAAAVEVAGASSLNIKAIDKKTGLVKIYYWNPGMKFLKEENTEKTDDITAGGYYYNFDKLRCQLELIINPSVIQVMNLLDYMKNKDGVLSIGNINLNEKGNKQLDLYIQNDYYLIMFVENKNGDINVRTVANKVVVSNEEIDLGFKSEFIEIAGEVHHTTTMTSDFHKVIKIFKEYLNTGLVSIELLD